MADRPLGRVIGLVRKLVPRPVRHALRGPFWSVVHLFGRVIGAFRVVVDNAPFSLGKAMPADRARACHARLEQLGVRLHPYPFSHSVAIVSDVDNARRGDYEGYTDLLVAGLGLDFGDSFRLFDRSNGNWRNESSAFFRCDGAPPPWSEDDRNLEKSLGFVELLRQFHLGNVDHLHGLNALGGRIVWLRDVSRVAGGRWVATIPEAIERSSARPFNFRCDLVPVVQVAIRSDRDLPESTTVTAARRTAGAPAVRFRRVPVDDAEPVTLGGPDACLTWFEIDGDDGWPDVVVVDDVDKIEIDASPAATIESVFLVNGSRRMLHEMITTMSDRLGVRSSLLTDHSSKLFVSAPSEARHGAQSAERALEVPVPALYGRVRDGAVAFSTLGDDPDSVWYVLPSLRDRFGVRFINPGGRSGEPSPGFDVANTVVPALTRDESLVYVARRCKVDLSGRADVPEHLRDDVGTGAFPHVVTAFLDALPRHPGQVWPIYTHLGNISPKSEVKSPYFPEAPLHRLQDHVFDITGTVGRDRRVWFTRASILYDYALMIRSIAPHVRREGPNTLRIRSWEDETLGQRLPTAPGQLHGLTFYVDDAERGAVLLDGEPIVELARNAPDETGRPSVTVVGAGIRHVIADEIDSVTLTETGVHREHFSPRDLDPVGCQFIAWTERAAAPTVRVGVIIETTSGGTFYFGDESLAPADCDATHVFPPAPAGTEGEARRRLAPFHAMTWRPEATPGGPLPSHPTRSVTLLVSGEPGDHLDVGRLEFLRPSTNGPPLDGGRCVIGGAIHGATPGMTVTLAYDDASGARVVRDDAIVDHAGFFVFTGVPVGVSAEVVATGPRGPRHPSRGDRVTVRGHDMSLVFT